MAFAKQAWPLAALRPSHNFKTRLEISRFGRIMRSAETVRANGHLAYVERNPVRAKLTSRAIHYEWSSAAGRVLESTLGGLLRSGSVESAL